MDKHMEVLDACMAVPSTIKTKPLTIAMQTAGKALRNKTAATPKHSELQSLYLEIRDVIRSYCDLHEHYYDVITCWIIATYFISVLHRLPRLVVTAPTRACGKSQVLKVMTSLITKAEKITPTSEAVLSRRKKDDEPVFLIDETDEWYSKMHPELTALLKDGWERGAKTFKCDANDNMQPKPFDIYMPLVLAGINIPEQMGSVLLSRCIVINCEKATRAVKDAELEDMKVMHKSLRNRLVRAVTPLKHHYKKGSVPKHSDSRLKDVWASLFGVADMAGQTTAINRAYSIIIADHEDDDVNTKLLRLTEVYLDHEDIRKKTRQGKIEEYAIADDLFELIKRDSDFKEISEPINLKSYFSRIKTFGVGAQRFSFDRGRLKLQGFSIKNLRTAFAKYVSA